MILLSIEQVLQIHEYQLARFGGLPGIKDMGLVESALQCVENRIYYAKESDPATVLAWSGSAP